MNAPVPIDTSSPAYSLPLDRYDVSDPALYQNDTWYPYFKRLRREAPITYVPDSLYGPYWSVTKYKDIMHCEVHHEVFSNEIGGITIEDFPLDLQRPSFIRMDPPKHDEQRKVASPIVAPANLANMEPLIRERTRLVLDALPRNETFDWVEHVSVKLTTMMLATLFDYPFEERTQLTYWSDVAICNVRDPSSPVHSEQERFEELKKMAAAMSALFNERRNQPPKFDLLSMLAHGESTRDMPLKEFMGNLSLLIVGGNDTTRNSMSGGLMALNQFPDQYRKLMANPKLIESLVPEIIRYHTPVIHMRRTTSQDTELGGHAIKAGDKVVMWYISGNRDEDAIENPNDFIIDRARPRQHLSFGFGIHRCVGNRLAELQLRILWEEILPRFPMIEVVGEPKRLYSNFIRGIRHLPVRIPG
ncbi:cytochrome P450 [Rhodopila globiformis]|uniref:Cytochrome P450 n=1 Tax=Rhodopila globiformis TaxID=1071 RepID=A0A2S6NH88_RHOGL|nr:cytochrome P450 [Rhodopila globiformis]PPQ33970.1 cytochrome P450 [Rhodopila globiformis]